MKQTIAALCMSVALIGANEVVAAHDTSTSTNVELTNTDHVPPGTFRAYGYLLTTRKCRVKRRVQIFFNYVVKGRGPTPEWTLVDVDTSSRTVCGPAPALNVTTGGVSAVKIGAARKYVGWPGHAICGRHEIVL